MVIPHRAFFQREIKEFIRLNTIKHHTISKDTSILTALQAIAEVLTELGHEFFRPIGDGREAS